MKIEKVNCVFCINTFQKEDVNHEEDLLRKNFICNGVTAALLRLTPTTN